MKAINEHIHEDLLRLRDELALKAFGPDHKVIDSDKAEIVFKINSCLYLGYPGRK